MKSNINISADTDILKKFKAKCDKEKKEYSQVLVTAMKLFIEDKLNEEDAK